MRTQKRVRKAALVLAIAMLGSMFAGCGNRSPVQGKWQHAEKENQWVEFKADGTGTYMSMGMITEFTYTWSEERQTAATRHREFGIEIAADFRYDVQTDTVEEISPVTNQPRYRYTRVRG